MATCKKCGKKIDSGSPWSLRYRYKYCIDCNDEIAESRGQLIRCGRKVEASLKAAADASGNPKIWTAGECSQEFLKSLIPV
jgi:hypothetical protein